MNDLKKQAAQLSAKLAAVPKAPVASKPAIAKKSPKYEKPYKAKCELTGEEVKGLYSSLKGLHEQTANNPVNRGDVKVLSRELHKIIWLDCTEWSPEGRCTNKTCENGLHDR
jgi:hypothetical protein